MWRCIRHRKRHRILSQITMSYMKLYIGCHIRVNWFLRYTEKISTGKFT